MKVHSKRDGSGLERDRGVSGVKLFYSRDKRFIGENSWSEKVESSSCC